MEATIKALKRTFQAPSQSSDPTKAQDLLAFRTIISMLSFLPSPTSQLASTRIIGESKDDRSTLTVLDALSAVLIREHEDTAVMAKPYDGFNLPIFACVVHPTDIPLLQSNTNSNSQGFWSRMRDFTISINPLTRMINGNTENTTWLPIIGDKVPADLVTASSKGNVSLLDIYLAAYW
jgi:hypothetical protein